MKKLYTLLTALLLCTFVWGESNYCGYPTLGDADYSNFRKSNKSVVFSWNTADNGDVVVTIAPGDDATTATFRNQGFEGDISYFTVLSGEGFATSEPASDYFYEKATINEVNTYTLYRTGNNTLPSPCKIRFSGKAVAWRVDGSNEYTSPTFEYNYGTLCGSTLDAPEITVSSDGIVTFNDVDDADSYKVYVYYGSAVVSIHTIISGQKVLTPYLAGNYSIAVKAFNSSTGAYSDFSLRKTWNAIENSVGQLPMSTNNPKLVSNGTVARDVLVYWDTEEITGNLLITLAPVDPNEEATTNWRGNGLTLSGFLYNGETFTDYFDYVSGVGTKTLKYAPKTGDSAPTFGGLISFTGTVEWKIGSNNPYVSNFSFNDYYYGSGCGTLSRPIISSLTDAGVITFASVPDATSYKAYVYNSASEKVYELVVTNGGTINYHPYLSDTYKVYLKAFGEDGSYSAYSAAADWALEANLAYLPQSEWCTTLYAITEHESEDVNVTWITDAQGNIIVSLSPVEGNTQTEATEFRGNTPMSIDNLKIGDSREDADTYFTTSYSGAVLKFTLIDPSIRPAYGTTFYYDGQVTYKTGTHGNAWPTMHFTHVYGSNCLGYNDHVNPIITMFSVVDKDVNEVTFHVEATDEDDFGDSHNIASYEISSDDNDFEPEIVTLDGDGNFTVSGLKDNETYTFTITAIDAFGNRGSANLEVTLPFNTKFDLAYKKECTAGAVQDNNTADKAVNGNPNNFWTCFAQGDASTTWWSVDLGTAYDIDSIMIHFNDLHAAYNIYSSLDESDWYGLYIGETASSQATKEYQHVNHSGRYLKVTSSDNRIGIREFKVYATGFSVPDATVPEVTIYEIDKDYTSVTLQINATDEDDDGNAGTITAINISGNNGFVTQNNVTLDGDKQITLSGLKNNKTYTFTVQVIDLAGNSTSENIVVVLPFNTAYNIALDGTASAGYSQNSAQTPDKANDGSTSTKWNTYGVDNSEGGYADNWWQVQLDAAYDITSIVANYQDVSTRDFVIEGSMDGSTWYIVYKGTTSSTEGEYTYEVAAPAQYVRYTYGNRYLAVYEFGIYASGFSTLTDDAPVITWTKVGTIDDSSVEIEIDAVDITTKPITKYMVSGIGEDPIELTASERKITFTSLSQSTHYTVSIQAKDESGNLSAAKEVEFTTTGSVSGLYLHSGLYGWEYPDERERFTATAVEGVYHYAANFATGNHVYKIYNASTQRCTWDACGAGSDHHFGLKSATEVSFYATDEDHMVCSADTLYLRGSLVGEDQELTWNDSRTIATWTGTVDLSGTKQFTLVKKLRYGTDSYSYDHDIYSSVQTFDGSYTQAVFTFDVTKMQGVWAENKVTLTLTDNADNSGDISNVNTRLADVTLNRSFEANTGNYTLVLPFDMTAEQCEDAFGAGYQLWYLSDSRIKENGDIYLNFVSTSSIVAGRPYLFCPATDVTSGVVISDVHINSTLAPSVTAQASFVGTYDIIPQATISTTSNAYLLGGNDWLYAAEYSSWDLKALRAYFTLNFTPVNGVAPRIRVVYNETGAGVSTDLDPLTAHPSPLTVTKLLRNGQLIIIRNGVEYNAQGQIIK